MFRTHGDITSGGAVVGLMLVLLAGHAGVAALLGTDRSGPRTRRLLALAPPLGIAILVVVWLAGGRVPVTASSDWVAPLGLTLAVRLDALAILMLALVAGVGVAVLAHADASVTPAQRPRVLAQLVLFAAAMAGLVLADDLILLFLFWEATSVLSFLLVGTKEGSPDARLAARRALAVTGGGGLAMLAGIVLLGVAADTTTLSGLAATPPTSPGAVTGLLLILVGILTKSAQWPFHGWLPGAMAAPAPVSAYLHSATMVKAGVYLAIRLLPVAGTVTAYRTTLTLAAAATVLWGGWQALRSDDLKRLLAFSTVSQLGLMMLIVAQGTTKALLAGVGLLVAHALAKAALFLATGTLEATHDTRDVRELAGAARHDRTVGVAVTAAFASLAGLPILGGFVAKEAGLVAMVDADAPLATLSLVVAVVGVTATAAYAVRVVRLLWQRSDVPVVGRCSDAMRFGPLGLAAGAALLGPAWPVFDLVAGGAAEAVDDGAAVHELTVWAGLNLALLLSVLALSAGVVVARLRDRRQVSPPRGGPHLYDRILDSLPRVGELVVRVIAPGRLPATTGWIVGIAAVLALPFLLSADASPGGGSTLGDLAMLGVVVGAVAVALVRHRFGAVLGLGVVGFTMAGWFATRGAPDLVLTQALVEMVVVLAFLLLLKRLPRRVPVRRMRWSTLSRVAVAVAAGATAAGVALATTAVVGPTGVTDLALEQSLPGASGRNVVNVILTDFRALDTMVEIAVLAVAALGVLGLFRHGRRGAT